MTHLGPAVRAAGAGFLIQNHLFVLPYLKKLDRKLIITVYAACSASIFSSFSFASRAQPCQRGMPIERPPV